MKKKPIELPSSELLHELLTYDAMTGKIYWKPRGLQHFTNEKEYSKFNMRYPYKEAGCYDRIRDYPVYRSISITIKNKTKKYAEHRIIYKMVYGVDPEIIDHINGIPDDNRILNLRSTTPQENNKNRKLSKNNTSGVNGVSIRIDKTKKRYVAELVTTSKSFNTFKEAVACRKAWERDNNYHPNHGRERTV
jgi:hypothetical protein